MTDNSSPRSFTAFRVLVLGGSYGGLTTVLNLLDLCSGKPERPGNEVPVKHEVPIEITLVDERDGFFHLIGSPLALIKGKFASEFWVKYDDMPALRHPKLRFLHGSVKSVNHKKMTAAIRPHGDKSDSLQLSYDYLVAATGFRRVWPTVPQALDRISYLKEAGGHIKLVQNATHGVVVIGGGAVGIEMAAEIKDQYPHTEVTLIHSRQHLLSAEPLPDKFKDTTLKELRAIYVNVILGTRVVDVIPGSKKSEIKLDDGTTRHASHVIWAISRPMPTASFLSPELLNQDREVVVRSSLQFSESVSNADCHLAIGDIAAWPPNSAPVIKRCGAAMYHGSIAAVNIYLHALHRSGVIQQPDYQTMPIYGPVMALALGKTAVGYSAENGVTSGRELCDTMFGDDLGMTLVGKHLGLDKDSR